MVKQLSLMLNKKTIELRDFQKKTISDLYKKIEKEETPVLLVAPTGSGKTVMMSEIIKDAEAKGSSCVLIVHRDPLVEQSKEILAKFGLEAGVIKAGYRPDLSQIIQIVSIQTLARRKKLFPELFRTGAVILFDEAHTTSFFNCAKEVIHNYQDNCVVIGATATPWRAKKTEGLQDFYKSMVAAPTPGELMKMGWLITPTYYSFQPPDLSKVKTDVRGDFKVSDLSNACNRPELVQKIVKEWFRLASGKTTIAFAVDVAHSRAIEEEFLRHNVPVEHIDAETPMATRRMMYRRLREKKTLVLCSIGVLTEGFDVPGVEAVLLCRPTKSKALHFQQIGRGLRIAPRKKTCLILDQSGNCYRYGFAESILRYTMDSSKDSGLEPLKTCPECQRLLNASIMTCPGCSYEFPRKEKLAIDTDLVQLSVPETITPSKMSPEEEKIFKYFKRSVIAAYTRKHHPFRAIYQVRELDEVHSNWEPPDDWWLNIVWGRPDERAIDSIDVMSSHFVYLCEIAIRKKSSLNWVKSYMKLEFGDELTESIWYQLHQPSFSVNLEQVWKQAISALELNTTRAILIQHGKLVAVENSLVTISMQRMPLLKMIERFLPHVEKAFSVSLKRPITVKLIVG